MCVATNCRIMYMSFSVGTWGGTRGDTRLCSRLGEAELPRRGGGGGGSVGRGGGQNTCDDVMRLAGSRPGVTFIVSTPESISGDEGGARRAPLGVAVFVTAGATPWLRVRPSAWRQSHQHEDVEPDASRAASASQAALSSPFPLNDPWNLVHRLRSYHSIRTRIQSLISSPPNVK